MDPTRLYEYSTSGRLVFGPKALDEIKKDIGPKEVPLISTDPGIVRAGILKKLTDLLEERGVHYHVFGEVEADPSTEVVEKAYAAYRDRGCNLIIGLGGGSSIDVAKTVGVCSLQKGRLIEYVAGKPVEGSLPPIVAVPTTAGTGSEATPFAIVADRSNKLKKIIRSPQFVPRLAILDPSLLGSIPPKVAAETGADALTHAIESYLSPNSSVVTEALALGAIRLICRHALRLIADSNDTDAAGQMLLGSCMAGMSFANTGLGLVHGFAHPVGVYFHLPHGLACALYLPSILEFNGSSWSFEKSVSLAQAMGRDVSGLRQEAVNEQTVFAVRELLAQMGIPKNFSQMGVPFRLDTKMVEDIVTAPSVEKNPRKAGRVEIEQLLRTAA